MSTWSTQQAWEKHDMRALSQERHNLWLHICCPNIRLKKRSKTTYLLCVKLQHQHNNSSDYIRLSRLTR
uniref:Uncharacterized protein n=1 Tax=Arundo donax TaxID=35708 RepID=A0A0A9DEI6_ARUDO